MSEAVFVCRDHGAACAQVPIGLRCSTCPLRGRLEIASRGQADERAAFERAYLAECLKTNRQATLESITSLREGDDYAHQSTTLAWRMWQAARGSAIGGVQEVPRG
jgi:hypothetical protein